MMFLDDFITSTPFAPHLTQITVAAAIPEPLSPGANTHFRAEIKGGSGLRLGDRPGEARCIPGVGAPAVAGFACWSPDNGLSLSK
jgi:hypothetical protein